MAKKPLRGESAQYLAAKMVDDVARFQEFNDSVLPTLQKALKEGWTAEKIYERYQALAAARAITIVARETDSGKALAAIREVLDRHGGKARESVDVTHKLENAPEEQLDALIRSKLNDSEAEEVH